MNTHKNQRKTGHDVAILITVLFMFSTLFVLPVSQHSEAASAEEIMAEIKTVYPILENPSFETGNFSGWTCGGASYGVSMGSTPDGKYFASLGGCLYVGYEATITSGYAMVSEFLHFYIQPRSKTIEYGTGYSKGTVTVSFYDTGHSLMGSFQKGISSSGDPWGDDYEVTVNTWTMMDWNLREMIGNNTFTQSEYIKIGVRGQSSDLNRQASFYVDGIYLGDYQNETNMLTINKCDAQTIQNQYSDIISTWATNSYGIPLNDVVISLVNYPLQSVSVNMVENSPLYGVYHLGYFNPGESKYVELGFSTPSAIGFFNATITFMGYNEIGQVLATETFNILFKNIMIMFTVVPNKDVVMQGDMTQMSITNNMDRDIWIRYTIRYDGSLIFQTPENIIFTIGELRIFSYLFVETGKYSFDYTIYFAEVGIQRELHLQKTITVIPCVYFAEKQTTYLSVMWDVEGNTSISFPVIVNNTGNTDLVVFVAITHPNGTIVVDRKTVWTGRYVYYYTIQIPPGGYDNTNFNIKTYRLVFETSSYVNESVNYSKPDFVYGIPVSLTEIYNIYGSNLYAILGNNNTYMVYEGERTISYPLGFWSGVMEDYPYLFPLIILFLSIGLIPVFLTARKKGLRRFKHDEE